MYRVHRGEFISMECLNVLGDEGKDKIKIQRIYLVDSLELAGILEELREYIRTDRISEAVQRMEELHPADRADIIEAMGSENQVLMLTSLVPAESADVLEEMEDQDVAVLAENLSAKQLAPIVEEMETDEAVDILSVISDQLTDSTLEVMTETEEVRQLLRYPADTAGGLMTTEAITLDPAWTVNRTLEKLRELGPQSDSLYYLFVTEQDGTLVGLLPIRVLVALDPQVRVESVMETRLITVNAMTDKEDCARMLSHYGFLAIPVVDDNNRFLGVITADDLIEVAEDEATEDMLRLAGIIADGEEKVFAPAKTSILNRLPWLAINIVTLLIAVSVIDLFEDLIAELVILAVFLPIVSGEGGNAGSQTVTVIIRGLALDEISLADTRKALVKEAVVSAVNGAIIGFGTGLVAFLWKGNFIVSLAIFLAMIFNFVMAALTGVLVPMLLKKMNIDPALASAAFVTGFTDTFGFLFFLGLVTILL